MVITKIPYGKCTVLYRRLIVLRKKTGVAHLYFRCVPMCFCVCNNVVHQDVFKANLSKAVCSPQTTARHSRTPCVSKGCHTPVKGKSWVNLWFHFNHIDLWPFWVKTITSFEVKRKDIARGVTKAFWLNSMTIQYLVQEMPLWKSWISCCDQWEKIIKNKSYHQKW